MQVIVRNQNGKVVEIVNSRNEDRELQAIESLSLKYPKSEGYTITVQP